MPGEDVESVLGEVVGISVLEGSNETTKVGRTRIIYAVFIV